MLESFDDDDGGGNATAVPVPDAGDWSVDDVEAVLAEPPVAVDVVKPVGPKLRFAGKPSLNK